MYPTWYHYTPTYACYHTSPRQDRGTASGVNRVADARSKLYRDVTKLCPLRSGSELRALCTVQYCTEATTLHPLRSGSEVRVPCTVQWAYSLSCGVPPRHVQTDVQKDKRKHFVSLPLANNVWRGVKKKASSKVRTQHFHRRLFKGKHERNVNERFVVEERDSRKASLKKMSQNLTTKIDNAAAKPTSLKMQEMHAVSRGSVIRMASLVPHCSPESRGGVGGRPGQGALAGSANRVGPSPRLGGHRGLGG